MECNNAIVFGSKGVNATGLIRSLGEAGYSVTFASNYSKIESKYTTAYLKLPDQTEKQAGCLIEYIKQLPSKPAIFPVDDHANFILDDYWSSFTEIAYCPHAKGTLRNISDKTAMAELAVEAGLTVAQYAKTKVSEEMCPMSFPVIVKPYAGYAGSKGDIRICRDADEYRTLMAHLSVKGYHDVMVQHLLEADNQYEIGLMGCSLPDGRVIIPCTIKKIRSYPTGRGSTSYAQIKNGLCGVDEDKIKTFVRKTGYIGLFDIEMIICGDTPYFIEINYRNGQYGYAPTAAGYNIPAAWARGMNGDTIQASGEVREIYYINERDDFLHVKEGCISFKEWMRQFHSAEAFGLFCKGDQRPFIRQYVKIPDRVQIAFRRAKHKLRDFFYREEWIIAIRPIGEKLLFEEGGIKKAFTLIPNSFRSWCADPFIISVGNKDYLFFEMFDRFNGRGVIGYREIDASGHIGKMKLAYETNRHLSFPFVFEKDGILYMMPESSYDKNLTLLRAQHFPEAWTVTDTWFQGQKICDSVMLDYEGLTYLLTQPVRIPYTNGELDIYFKNKTEWQPSEQNPVVKDASCARMAGKIIHRAEKLIRPAQDCSEGNYGGAVSFYEIKNLSQDSYEESLLAHISASDIVTKGTRQYDGIHTYNKSKRYEVIDLKLKKRFKLAYLIGVLYQKTERKK